MSLQINNLHITTATAKPKTPPQRKFTISPALYGRTEWNLDNLSRMNISGSGQWTITPTSNFTANFKLWGAGGGCSVSADSISAGAGGYSSGTVSFISGVPYVIVVGAGGSIQSGIRTGPGPGGGGYAYDGYSAVSGGGMTGIFSGSYSQNRSIVIAGGGGSKVFGIKDAGAGGGSSGQASSDSGVGGGTQSSGGTSDGGYTGSALLGGRSTVLRNYFGGGGGGYFGGGGTYIGVAGGGSGYIRAGVISGSTVAGYYGIAGNSSDPDRGTAGNAGNLSVRNAPDGRLIIS